MKHLKNNFTILLLIVFSSTLFAQEENESPNQKQPKHEIGLDFLDYAKYRRIELSYNYLLNESNSIGTTLNFFEKNQEFWKEKGYQDILGIDLNYKHYFSKNKTQGLYVEGFAKYEFGHLYKLQGFDDLNSIKDYHAVNVGLGVGYKYVTKNNLFFDLNIRYNQTINNPSSYDPSFKRYPHEKFTYGFSIGKRF